jgi:predicted ATPase/DNA-binding CsgD family transcriptional regulator
MSTVSGVMIQQVERVCSGGHSARRAAPTQLEALLSPPNNLPHELSSFVGRGRELDEIGRALASTRALTLTGAGGCGKTRLALRVAGAAAESSPGGTWWVELAALADPAVVGDALAAALSVRPLPGQSSVEAVAAHLASRCALVVLDNCEHLLAACAALAGQLLTSCPGLTVLATSREPLGLPGETSWLVPSLSLPELGSPDPVESLSHADAVRLFIERAVQVAPHFTVTNRNAPAVAQICHDLDGIPLAIELAAARVRLLSVEQIAGGLSDRFRLLTGGASTALARQQTLLASVEWSHDLLSEPERILLRRLGVFLGGFTLDGCEDVCPGEGLARPAVLDVLSSLVDKSLVLVQCHDGRTRYRLLETVRHYALHQLGAAGEAELLRARHRDSFVSYGHRMESELVTERLPGALDLLDADAANLHAAIEHATGTEPELAAGLCTSLMLWWRLRGLFPAGLGAVSRTLAALPDGPSTARGRTLCTSAYLAVNAGDGELCERSAHDALTIGESLGDDWIQGRALHALTFLWFLSDPHRADRSAERGRRQASAAGDDFPYADTTQLQGLAYLIRDNYSSARPKFEESYAVAERNGYRDILATHWMGMAMMPWGSPEPRACHALLERSLAISAEVDETVIHGFASGQLGWVETILGEPEAAVRRLIRCRELLVASGSGLPLTQVGIMLGIAQASLGRLDEARATLTDASEQGEHFAFTHTQGLIWLAGVERRRGEPDAAHHHLDHASEVNERLGSAVFRALATYERARLAADGGEWTTAESLLHEALQVVVDGGHGLFVPDLLDALAQVAAGLDSHAEAARLLTAAERARAQMGCVRWSGEVEPWAALDRTVREALGDEAYDAAAAEGGALLPDEAIAYVQRARGSRKRPAAGWAALTPTELTVARHAATGLTNPEIGRLLFITRGTVKIHLSHIYAKLAVRNRTELTAEVIQRNTPQGTKG